MMPFQVEQAVYLQEKLRSSCIVSRSIEYMKDLYRNIYKWL